MENRNKNSEDGLSYFINRIKNAKSNNELIEIMYCEFIVNQFESPISAYAYSDFDNSNFTQYLENKGFHVAKNSFSNYRCS